RAPFIDCPLRTLYSRNIGCMTLSTWRKTDAVHPLKESPRRMDRTDFERAFERLTNHPPFPWQWDLYQRFLAGHFPQSCNLPPGLGKTAVIHIWLLALAHAPALVPRRLVYVVNRRTVVDQSTEEARKLRDRLPDVPEVVARLRALCADRNGVPLAISTLRGQF